MAIEVPYARGYNELVSVETSEPHRKAANLVGDEVFRLVIVLVSHKLASVVSDIMGKSSRDMLEAMVNGETDPESLAGFARKTMKKKKEELELALRGNMSSHQCMMLKTMLTHVDFLTEQISELDLEVANRLAPFQQDLDRLDSIPASLVVPLSKSLPRLAPTSVRASRVQHIYVHGSSRSRS